MPEKGEGLSYERIGDIMSTTFSHGAANQPD